MTDSRPNVLFELTKIAGVDRCIVTLNNFTTTIEIALQFAELVRQSKVWEEEKKTASAPLRNA